MKYNNKVLYERTSVRKKDNEHKNKITTQNACKIRYKNKKYTYEKLHKIGNMNMRKKLKLVNT